MNVKTPKLRYIKYGLRQNKSVRGYYKNVRLLVFKQLLRSFVAQTFGLKQLDTGSFCQLFDSIGAYFSAASGGRSGCVNTATGLNGELIRRSRIRAANSGLPAKTVLSSGTLFLQSLKLLANAITLQVRDVVDE